MKKLVLLILIVFIASCAAPQQRPRPSQQGFDNAESSLMRCYATNTERLDDGVSDASTIGNSLAMACGKEFNYQASLFIRNESEAAQRKYWARIAREKHALNFATAFVLQLST